MLTSSNYLDESPLSLPYFPRVSSSMDSFASMSCSSLSTGLDYSGVRRHCTLAVLPRELLEEILVLVVIMSGGVRPMIKLRLVCSAWNILLDEEIVWLRISRMTLPVMPLLKLAEEVSGDYPTSIRAALQGRNEAAASASENQRGVERGHCWGGAQGGVLANEGEVGRVSKWTKGLSKSFSYSGNMAYLPYSGSRWYPPCKERASHKTANFPPRLSIRWGQSSLTSLSRSGINSRSLDVLGNYYTTSIPEEELGTRDNSNMKGTSSKIRSSYFERIGSAVWEVLVRSSAEIWPQRRSDLRSNSKAAVRGFLQELRYFYDMRQYNRVVAHRRRFVLQVWISSTVFFLTLFLATCMCSAEHWKPETMCNPKVCFSFLYLAFAGVFGTIITNVIMAAHFDTASWIERLVAKKELIISSIVFLFLFTIVVIIPAHYVQRNVQRLSAGIDTPVIPWWWCAAPAITALCLWQLEVLIVAWQNVVPYIRSPSRITIDSLFTLQAHMTPLFFLFVGVCIILYLEQRENWILTLAFIPLMIIALVPASLLLRDYHQRRRPSEGIAAASLLLLELSPLAFFTSVAPRGLHLLPAVLSGVCVFLSLVNSVVDLVDEALIEPDFSISAINQ